MMDTLDVEDRMVCATCRRAQDDVEFADLTRGSKQIRYKTCRTCRLDKAGKVTAPPGHWRLADGFIPAITCEAHASKGCVKCYPPRILRPSARVFRGTYFHVVWENRWLQIQEVWEVVTGKHYHYYQVAFRTMTWRMPVKFASKRSAVCYILEGILQ